MTSGDDKPPNLVMIWPHAQALRKSPRPRFELLNAAWPHAPDVLERAKIGRQRSNTLSEIGRLQQRIVQAQAVSLEDAAVQLRRLVAMATGLIFFHRTEQF